jgi:AraC-like DNA-binding protein
VIFASVIEAKPYLSNSDYSIKEIDYLLGFEEPTNFTKFFRSYSTPLQFREELLFIVFFQ